MSGGVGGSRGEIPATRPDHWAGIILNVVRTFMSANRGSKGPRYIDTFEKCHFEERERRMMSFRRSEATEKSKGPSWHSGHGFLPSVEMTKMMNP